MYRQANWTETLRKKAYWYESGLCFQTGVFTGPGLTSLTKVLLNFQGPCWLPPSLYSLLLKTATTSLPVWVLQTPSYKTLLKSHFLNPLEKSLSQALLTSPLSKWQVPSACIACFQWSTLKSIAGTGEKAQQLRVLAALVQDLNCVANTHIKCLATAFNYSSRGIQHLWPLQAPGLTCTALHA